MCLRDIRDKLQFEAGQDFPSAITKTFMSHQTSTFETLVLFSVLQFSASINP